jgi:hypothetical protein
VGGLAAAGLGLGAAAVLVLFLWIISPYPDSGGIEGALHIAADVWLLAHGVGLVRMETVSGTPAPAAVTPLLLAALPVWLLFRAGADAAAEDGDGGGHGGGHGGLSGIGWLVGGYMAVGGCVVLYTSYGPVRSDALSALLHLPVLAGLASAAGAWTERGRPPIPLPGMVPRDAAASALRAAAAGVAVLVGGGALLAGLSLAWHAGASAEVFARLSESLAGQLAVLLLALALIPNAAVWGASYALGPGFTVGAGSAVGPAGASGYPVLPDFPLLAALPGEGCGTAFSWAALALPVCAGLAVGCFAAGRRTARGTAGVAACGALMCGPALALLAAVASGPLGAGAMGHFGPSAWLTGAVAVGWTLVVGVPTGLLLRWWRGREARPEAPPERIPAEQVAAESDGASWWRLWEGDV